MAISAIARPCFVGSTASQLAMSWSSMNYPIIWGEEAWDFFTLVAERVGAEFVQRGGFAKTAWLDTLLDETGTGSVVIPIDID